MSYLALASTSTTSTGFSLWEYLVLFAVFVGIMVVTSILPQRRRDRETRQTLDKVRRGVRVVTRGGVYGMVTDVQDDTVMLRIADKVEIRVAKAAVSEVVRSADAPDADAQGDSSPTGGRRSRRQS